MSGSRLLRTGAGLAVLGGVLAWTGHGPFVAGLRSLDVPTLALGSAIAVPTTVACAWRWQLVARGLGAGLRLGPAVASCYLAQLLNTTLPGGIVGDLHRGVRHGRAVGDPGLGLRAVAWERCAGQVVQVAIAATVLVLLPSPVRPSATAVLGLLGVLTALLAATALLRRLRIPGASPVPRLLRAAADDLRRGLLHRRAWPGVALASTVAVVGHVATYLVAARAVGVAASPARLLPLALLVLLAMAVPLSVAGWGPREGAAAWAFAAAGLGAGPGVATAVAYGVMVTVASLPGALVLVARARAGGGARAVVRPPSAAPQPVGGGRPDG